MYMVACNPYLGNSNSYFQIYIDLSVHAHQIKHYLTKRTLLHIPAHFPLIANHPTREAAPRRASLPVYPICSTPAFRTDHRVLVVSTWVAGRAPGILALLVAEV